MTVLLHPAYFPPIAQFVVMLSSEKTLLEVGDNYQKQTYRNRMYLHGANGKQLLSIPIKHSKNPEGRRYQEVVVDNTVPWQRNHLRTLQTAYRRSAYYEYFEDRVESFFHKTFDKLMDYALASINLVEDCLQTSVNYDLIHNQNSHDYQDYKGLTDAKADIYDYSFESYFQVFEDKNGFVENLSILDLVFSMGPRAQDYLMRQTLPLKKGQ